MRKKSKKTAGRQETEEMAWAPPRNKTEWPSWEEAATTVESEWRLEPEGKAGVWKSFFPWTWRAKAVTSR